MRGLTVQNQANDGRSRAEGGAFDQEAAHRVRLVQAGQMLAGVVHEINNPLAVILGYTQLLLDRCRDEDDRRDLQCILDETRRLATLVEDMLAYTRRGTDAVETVDLARVVQSAINLTTHGMRQGRISVVATLPERSLFVRGSHGSYVQVLLNLLTNARQSLVEGRSGDRGISIRIEPVDDADRIDVLVTNNGPAIPADEAETIFQPFYTTKTGGEGTGLGLALCRNLVERYSGRIVLDWSRPDEGVCFRVSLPRA